MFCQRRWARPAGFIVDCSRNASQMKYGWPPYFCVGGKFLRERRYSSLTGAAISVFPRPEYPGIKLMK